MIKYGNAEFSALPYNFGDDIMKKFISALLSVLMFFSTFSICQTVIAQELRQNNILAVSNSVSKLVDEYDNAVRQNNESDDKRVTKEVKTHRLIVKTKEQIDMLNAVDYVKGLGFYFVQFEDYDSAKFALDYYKSKGITVEFDSLIKNSFSDEASASTTDDQMWAYKRVGSDKAIEYLSNKSLNNVTVAVLDTGVDYTHELFTDRITRTDLNFSNSGMENDCMDSNGHGTSVAGIVALSTPDNVKIEPYRIGEDDGSLFFSSMILAYEYILNSTKKPDIINMSYGKSNLFGLEIYSEYYDELYKNGLVMVAASGNDYTFADQTSPGCFDTVFSVASSDVNNKKSAFSNFGNAINVAAPGENVYTSKLGGGYTSSFSGTSASSPLTCGAAAILLSVNNNLTNAQVYNQIEATATDVQIKGYTNWCGSGIINFEKLTGQPVTEGEVIFSIDESDCYDDTLYVELSSSNPNAIIKYSTDLTIPDNENGITYTEPISVDEHAVILATVTEPDKVAGKYSLNEYNVIYHVNANDFEITDYGTINSYNGTHSSIIIPDEIAGVTPIKLGNELFKNNKNILSVQLPDSVKEIGMYAFDHSGIQSIIGNGVTKINGYAFQGAENLYYENLPNVESIAKQAFSQCINLTQRLSFEESVTSIGSYAFSEVPIDVVSLPNYTKEVYNCFSGSNIREIYLPQTTYLQRAFFTCPNLTKVYAPKVTELDDSVFYECVSLYEFDFSNIEAVYEDGLSCSYFIEINLPKCVTLEKNAFKECKSEKVSLPKATEIPNHCFYQCRYLEELEIPNVEHFENTDVIFSNVYCLKQLIIPKADNFPIIHIYAYEDGPWWTEPLQEMNLEAIYAPKVTEISDMTTSEHDANDNVTSRSIFELLNNVKWAFLPSLTNGNNLPCSEEMMLYLSESFNCSKNDTHTDKTNYTVIAPTDSYAKQYANENGYTFIPTDFRDENIENPLNVTDLGRSICCSVAGLRFGFTWNNIVEIETLANDVEYGFIYSQKGIENLSVDNVDGVNVKSVIANNRVTNGDITSFNLVFANIPKAYYDRDITARAYVYIDGMYFYSNIQKGSFGGVAKLVLNDNEIDKTTKDAVRNLIE